MLFIKYLKKVFQEFSRDRGSMLAAAIAYTAIFATVPFLVVITSFASLVFGQRAIDGTLFSNIQDLVGPQASDTLQKAIAHANQTGHSVLALIIGLVISLFAASALTAQLQRAFDSVFKIQPKQGGGIKRFAYVKVRNIALVVLASVVIIMSVAATALLSAIGASISAHFNESTSLLQITNLLTSLAVFVVFLYLLYRMLPDAEMPRLLALWTALIIGVLFMVGKLILGWVIGHNATVSAYGAAASLITLLLWFYYTAQILLLGAEGMKVYAKRHDIKYQPKPTS